MFWGLNEITVKWWALCWVTFHDHNYYKSLSSLPSSDWNMKYKTHWAKLSKMTSGQRNGRRRASEGLSDLVKEYEDYEPGPKLRCVWRQGHAFNPLPWPEISPSNIFISSSMLRTSSQNLLQTILAFQKDTNDSLLRGKLDLHALAQTLNVLQLFILEGISG